MPALVDAALVDRVEVIRVQTAGWAYWASWPKVPGDTLGVSTGSELEELLRLLSQLPDGEQMRCFTPAYGLRLLNGGRVLAETAICFRCNKAVTKVGEQRGWFKFDAHSAVSQRLLGAMARYDPHPPAAA